MFQQLRQSKHIMEPVSYRVEVWPGRFWRWHMAVATVLRRQYKSSDPGIVRQSQT